MSLISKIMTLLCHGQVGYNTNLTEKWRDSPIIPGVYITKIEDTFEVATITQIEANEGMFIKANKRIMPFQFKTKFENYQFLGPFDSIKEAEKICARLQNAEQF